MADKRSDIVQGTLHMLYPQALALEPMHGYGIAIRREQVSGALFTSTPAPYLSPCRGCNEKGWSKRVESHREQQAGKYYTLTQQGQKLDNETREWGRQVASITGILEGS